MSAPPEPGPPGPHRPPKAGHGPPSELSWDSGQGRQPYDNQDEGRRLPPPTHEVECGDRGAHSGTHQEQAERSRGTP